MKLFEKLNADYVRLREELENENFEIEQEVFDLEAEVQEKSEITSGREQEELKRLLKQIKSMKKEFDLYDEDAERDMMLPGEDDDF